MDALGINTNFLIAQLLIVILFIALPVGSLVDLAKKKLSGTALALWVLVICAVPFLGVLAYWIVRPTALELKN